MKPLKTARMQNAYVEKEISNLQQLIELCIDVSELHVSFLPNTIALAKRLSGEQSQVSTRFLKHSAVADEPCLSCLSSTRIVLQDSVFVLGCVTSLRA
jgi:hypothetical protein